jgi:hypothetical protein
MYCWLQLYTKKYFGVFKIPTRKTIIDECVLCYRLGSCRNVFSVFNLSFSIRLRRRTARECAPRTYYYYYLRFMSRRKKADGVLFTPYSLLSRSHFEAYNLYTCKLCILQIRGDRTTVRTDGDLLLYTRACTHHRRVHISSRTPSRVAAASEKRITFSKHIYIVILSMRFRDYNKINRYKSCVTYSCGCNNTI